MRVALLPMLLFAAVSLLACEPAPREDSGTPESSAAVAADRSTPRRDAARTAATRAAATRAAATRAAVTRDPCRVTTVSDGDSFRCADKRRIRLLLLDAPEMSQPPFGVRARDALRARLRRGDTVWLEYDVQREDRYGRTLAHAWTEPQGGTHVNLAMARDGWAVAVVFPPNVRHLEAIRGAVGRARAERRGCGRTARSPASPSHTSAATVDVT